MSSGVLVSLILLSALCTAFPQRPASGCYPLYVSAPMMHCTDFIVEEAKPGSALRYNICCMSVRRRYVSFSTWWRQGTDSRSQGCSTSIMMLAKVVILLGAYWPTAHVILTALHAGRWCVRQHGEDDKCEVCSKRHTLETYSLWRHVSGLEEDLIVMIGYA
jgi:hypothetical protein